MSSPDRENGKRPPGRAKWIAIAGISGAAAVILGALGAHGPVADHLDARGSKSVSSWETAVYYHLVHSGILLCWAIRPAWIRPSYPGAFLVIGMLGFSGSLYFLAAFGTSWLGPVTPVGGVFLIAGWLAIALASFRCRDGQIL